MKRALRGGGVWRALRVAAGVSALLTFLSALAFAALWIRLSMGPIEANDLGKRIAQSLSERSGMQIVFGATHVSRTDRGPTIEVDKLEAIVHGRTVVSAPQARVSLDPWALLKMDVRPSWLEVQDLTIKLLVQPDGSLAFSAAADPDAPVAPLPISPSLIAPNPSLEANGNVSTPPSPQTNGEVRAAPAVLGREIAAALSRLVNLAVRADSPLGGVGRLGVTRGRLMIDDQTLARKSEFSGVEIILEKKRALANFVLRAQGARGPIQLKASAQVAHNGKRALDYEVKNLTIDEIILFAGLRRAPIDSDAALDAVGSFELGEGDTVAKAQSRAMLGPGYLRFEDFPDQEILFFDEVALSAHWEREGRRIQVDALQYRAGETRLIWGGSAAVPRRLNETWSFSLGLLEPADIAPDGPSDSILTLNELSLEGTTNPTEEKTVLNRLAIKGHQLDAQVHAEFVGGQAPTASGDFQAHGSAIRSLLRVTPSLIASKARSWMLAHVKSGMFEQAEARFSFDKSTLEMLKRDEPPPDDALLVNFQISDAVLHPFSNMPEISKLSGSARVTGHTASLSGPHGALEVGTGKTLHISDFRLVVPDSTPANSPASLEANVQGSMDAVALFLAHDAVSVHASLPIDPQSLSGAVDAKVKIDFKIGPDANDSDVRLGVFAQVSNFVADKLIGKERFEIPQLTVVGDSTGIRANGAGKFFGGPALLDLRKGIGQPAVIIVTAAADDAARAKNNLNLQGVSGVLGVKLTSVLGGKTPKTQFEIDLTKAALNNPAPGLVKAAGKPGKATFSLVQKDKALRLEDLAVDAGNSSLRGAVELTANGDLASAKFSTFKISPGDDMRLEISRSGDVLKLTARGGSIDARPYIAAMFSDDKNAKDVGNLDIDLKSPVLSGYAKQIISNADLKITRRTGAIRQISGTAFFGRAPLAINTTRADNGMAQINIAATNAGALLAFTDLYARMEGGELSANVQINGKVISGQISIKDFFLRDEPALKKLVNEGAARAEAQAHRIDGSLVKFDRLQSLFAKNGSKIELQKGIMNGAEIGLTMEGWFDEAQDALNISGSFIPAYALNSIFSKIPIVDVLTSGARNEGILAVNYRATGRIGSPNLTVNPLSAVTPGIFRKMMGVVDGTGENQQDPKPRE